MPPPPDAPLPPDAPQPPAPTAAASDSQLIAAARAGDPAAYGVLYERHSPVARRVARKLVGATDADDVVAEAFTRVLSAIKRGAGPSEAFRPYLLTSVRRIALDHLSGQRSQIPTDVADLPDLGEPVADPAVESLERSLVVRAFRSLPERWSAVLWHTEVEGARPAQVARLLGMTPNGVAALSYRAREGLRQAYLQLHTSTRAKRECLPVVGQLGAHVRGGLSRRDARAVDDHLRTCTDCRAARAELAVINRSLRGALAPVFLGGALAGAAAHGGAVSSGLGSALRWLASALRHRPVVQAAAGLAATALLVPGATVLPTRPVPPRTALGEPRTGAGRHAAPARPAPGGRSGSPAPARGTSPGATPTSRPSSAPSPRPSQVRLTAKLGVQVSVTGLLKVGIVAVVDVQVSDPGTAATKAVTARMTLPAGISLLGLGPVSAGWSCGPASGGTTSCGHGPLAAGAASTVSFRVLVVGLAGCGVPIEASAVSGSLTASGQSAATVTCLL